MYEPGVVLIRDVWKYEAAWLGLLLQGVVVVKTRRSGRKAGPSRPNSDVTWFVPVYLWGIASVLHVHWSLAGGTFTQCWGPSPWAFAEHAAFSGMMLIGVVSCASCRKTLRGDAGSRPALYKALCPSRLLPQS